MTIEQDRWMQLVNELRETQEEQRLGLIGRITKCFQNLPISYCLQRRMKRLKEAAGTRRKLKSELKDAKTMGYFNSERNAEAAIRRISEGYNPRYVIREYKSYIKRLEEIYSIGCYSQIQHDSRKLGIQDPFPTEPILRGPVRLPKRY